MSPSAKFDGWQIDPKTLNKKEKFDLVNQLYPIAQSAFDQAPSDGFYTDVQNHILQHEHVLVTQTIKGELVGFRMWSTYIHHSTLIVYLAGMCIIKDFQNQGLGQIMLEHVHAHVNTHYPNWSYMGLRTQNPVMQKCFAKLAKTGSVFRFGDVDIPNNIQKVAAVLANKINDDRLDVQTLLSPGIYGSSLYGQGYDLEKKSQGTAFSKLNQAAGDAAYCIWQR